VGRCVYVCLHVYLVGLGMRVGLGVPFLGFSQIDRNSFTLGIDNPAPSLGDNGGDLSESKLLSTLSALLGRLSGEKFNFEGEIILSLLVSNLGDDDIISSCRARVFGDAMSIFRIGDSSEDRGEERGEARGEARGEEMRGELDSAKGVKAAAAAG